MQTFIALLRAVNVGGTGKLSMPDLKSLCEAAGFREVRTYIASGNVMFASGLDEAGVKAALERRLQSHAGTPIGVMVRTAPDLAEILARNPFADAPGNRVMAIFLDHHVCPSAVDSITGRADHEQVVLGGREIFVFYGQGMAQTKLRIPAAKNGTARNMNTVARLVALSSR